MKGVLIGVVLVGTAFLAVKDAEAAAVAPVALTKRKFTTAKVEIAKPTGDPVTAGSADNEFTFMTAAGVATIPVEAAITPTSLAASVSPTIKWTLDPIPAGVTLTWNNPWPGQPTAGQGRTAIATLTGYPANNAGFGLKTIKMEVMQGTRVIQTKTTTIELFFERDMTATGRTAPNWFFYWNQTPAGTAEAQYSATTGNFGTTPAMLNWATYGGPRRRVTLDDSTRLNDRRRDGTNQVITGIDLFANVILHENFHVTQVFSNNGVAFSTAVTGLLRDAPSAGWSFNRPTTDARWNHFTDLDHNHVLSPGDPVLDTDADDLADTLEPTAAERATCAGIGSGDIECQAELHETNPEGTHRNEDWANPGKQHRGPAFSD